MYIRLLRVNNAAKHLLNIHPDQTEAMTAEMIADCVIDATAVVLSGGTGKIPTRIAAPDGNWIETEAQLIVPSGAPETWEKVFVMLSAPSPASGTYAENSEMDRLRSVIDVAPVGYQSLGADGRILEVNQTWLDILGYREEHVIGARFQDFLFPNQQEEFRERFARFKERGSVSDVEFEMRRQDGQMLKVLFNGRIVYNGDGTVARTICILQNISERNRIEEELRESKERFEQLAESVSEIFWLRTEKKVLYISPAYERIFGRSCQSLYDDPSSFLECVHESDRDYLRSAHEREWESGVPIDLELRVVREDGSVRWISIRSFPIQDEEGETVRSAGIAQDITDQKYAEEALHESIARFRNIVEAAAAGYFFVDLEGRYGYVNNAWLRMHKLSSPGEIIGRPFSVTFPDEDTDLAPMSLEQMLTSDNGFQCECARLCKDGSIGYHLFSGNPVIVHGKQIGIEGFLIDITDRKKTEQALMESEERFRAAFQTSPDSITISREFDGGWVDVNEGFERISGYRREEVIGSTSIDIDLWVDPSDRLRLVEELREKGLADNFVARIRCKDGRIIIGSMSARTIMLSGLRHLLTITRDITEQCANERVLAMRDRILSAVSTSADILLRQGSLEEGLRRVLREVGSAAGVSRAYVFRNDPEPSEAGFTCTQIAEWADEGITPEVDNPVTQRLSYREAGIEHWIDILGNNEALHGLTESFEGPIRKIFEDQEIQSIALVPIFARHAWWGFLGFDECREPRNWTKTELDALRSAAGIVGARVERQLAEAELRDSETKFREITEMLPEAVYECDVNGVVTYANYKAAEYFGYEPGYYLTEGLRLTDVIVPEETERAMRFHEYALKHGHHDAAEYTAVRQDGSRFPITVRANRIVRNGEAVGVRGIVIDVSSQKALEQEQLRAQKLESLGILAGGLAHDFNNLLTGVLGNIAMVRGSGQLHPDLESGLDAAERAALRARDLTRQLLTFSKGGEPVKKVISVSTVVADSVSFALRGSNVKSSVYISPNLRCVNGDAGQIGQVIHNLAINAVQAMPDGGTLSIIADNRRIAPGSHTDLRAGDYVVISVTDEGTGIPEQVLPRIFDPYFTTKETGSGLGLATSYSIVRKHAGRIEVDSEQNKGTTFTVYLPAAVAEECGGETVVERDIRGYGRILLMDDESYIRDLASRVLTKHGFEVDTVADGAEALEHFEAARAAGRPYDLVVLDLTIPGGMGGKETIERLRAIDSSVKAIVCSGYSNDPVMARHDEFGFASVVVKPYRPADLAEAVATVLQSTSNPDSGR
ncbi:PAS domain S-box protein [bacterium]|nr:PAS domain S-box protein [bacterium]